MAERTKHVLAVGWGKLKDEQDYFIFELGDPRRAKIRCFTEMSLHSGRSKDWDIIRYHNVSDVLDSVHEIYKKKHNDVLQDGLPAEEAIRWIALGWAVKICVGRTENQVFIS